MSEPSSTKIELEVSTQLRKVPQKSPSHQSDPYYCYVCNKIMVKLYSKLRFIHAEGPRMLDPLKPKEYVNYISLKIESLPVFIQVCGHIEISKGQKEFL